MMDDRLVELEIRVAYQEKTIAELDAVVREFAERTAKLERELAELRATMQSTPHEVGPHDEEPPHY
jgi:SlyX protein